MLGNGRQMWDRFTCAVTDEKGNAVPCALHWRIMGVGGALYFLGLPLRAGATFALPVSGKDWYAGTSGSLSPGRYRLTIAYQGGQSGSRDASEMPKCWEGKLVSNTVSFEVVAK